jgi:hypothetical protein
MKTKKPSPKRASIFVPKPEIWETPQPPLQLNEGDEVTVRTTMSSDNSTQLSFKFESQDGTVVAASGLAKGYETYTCYYYVKESDFYYCVLQVVGGVNGHQVLVTVSFEVVNKTPNLLFLVVGVIVLVGGATAIAISFLYKTNNKAAQTAHV